MKKILFFSLFSMAMVFKTSAQNDSIIINQDSKLLKVLELKKIVNQEAFTSGQYTVQIFSGNFKDYQELLNLINKKRILIPFPLPLAQFSARFFEILPNPLLTRDQLKLLKYDNISSGKYKTNSEIGIPSVKFFDQEVKKYCYMWREGGQFSTEKYTSEDLKNKTN